MSSDSPWKMVVYDRDGFASPRYLGSIQYLGDDIQLVTADDKAELRARADELLPELQSMVHEPDDPLFDEVIDL